MMKLRVMAGPVYSAATVPVMEKSPAPMMAPTPKAMSPHGPSTRFRVLLPDSLASAIRSAKDFLINNPMLLILLIDNWAQIYGLWLSNTNELSKKNENVIQRSFSDEESRLHSLYVTEILRFALNDTG